MIHFLLHWLQHQHSHTTHLHKQNKIFHPMFVLLCLLALPGSCLCLLHVTAKLLKSHLQVSHPLIISTPQAVFCLIHCRVITVFLKNSHASFLPKPTAALGLSQTWDYSSSRSHPQVSIPSWEPGFLFPQSCVHPASLLSWPTRLCPLPPAPCCFLPVVLFLDDLTHKFKYQTETSKSKVHDPKLASLSTTHIWNRICLVQNYCFQLPMCLHQHFQSYPYSDHWMMINF